jgi:hypothetical protein
MCGFTTQPPREGKFLRNALTAEFRVTKKMCRTDGVDIFWLSSFSQVKKAMALLGIKFTKKEKGLEFLLTPCKYLVAGRGFEPLTFGL